MILILIYWQWHSIQMSDVSEDEIHVQNNTIFIFSSAFTSRKQDFIAQEHRDNPDGLWFPSASSQKISSSWNLCPSIGRNVQISVHICDANGIG